MPEIWPASPCIQVCVLDSEGYCTGCYRTMAEISGWLSMDPSQRRAVLDLLAERATRLRAAAP
ncbi:MAG TPA: DUF1289 domain-containing protein [Steroidobacteraceae bacterium]